MFKRLPVCYSAVVRGNYFEQLCVLHKNEPQNHAGLNTQLVENFRELLFLLQEVSVFVTILCSMTCLCVLPPVCIDSTWWILFLRISSSVNSGSCPVKEGCHVSSHSCLVQFEFPLLSCLSESRECNSRSLVSMLTGRTHRQCGKCGSFLCKTQTTIWNNL